MIKAENLTKRFDDMIAVDHINAEIKDASVFGLIGTNGAGKSTFLRMMSGVLKHNLRELEDICDHVGLLHKGGILLSKDLDDMKLNIHKIQCVLREGMDADDLVAFDRLKTERRGKLITITVRGSREEAESLMESYRPVFYEIIPLSLEEIFISETEVAGYDIKKLIL